MKVLVGVDIGGTKSAVTIGKQDIDPDKINVLDKLGFQTRETPLPDQLIPCLMEGIIQLLNRNDIHSNDILGVGISCGGPLDSKRGLILSPPNLPGWDNVPVNKLFHEKFNTPVALQNDANACALAEWKFGAGRGYQNVVFLTFGTGLGAGLILDGKLYSGTNDMAGEAGHIRLDNFGPVGYGKAGSFEGFCSGGGIAQLAQSLVKEKLQMGEKVSFCKNLDEIASVTSHIVAKAAMDGDALAKMIFRISGSFLGKGLSILIDILNPEVIIIGSIYNRAENLLADSMNIELQKESLTLSREVCKIVPAFLGEALGDYAALSVAYNNLLT